MMEDPELLHKLRRLRDFVAEVRGYTAIQADELDRDMRHRLVGEMLLIHIVEHM